MSYSHENIHSMANFQDNYATRRCKTLIKNENGKNIKTFLCALKRYSSATGRFWTRDLWDEFETAGLLITLRSTFDNKLCKISQSGLELTVSHFPDSSVRGVGDKSHKRGDRSSYGIRS